MCSRRGVLYDLFIFFYLPRQADRHADVDAGPTVEYFHEVVAATQSAYSAMCDPPDWINML